MSIKAKNRIEELTNLINKWNKEYFDDENPSVSDRVYDSHLKELVELEKQYPQYIVDNTPTQKIGSSLKNKFKKVKHDKPMLSLDKAYNFEELIKFFDNVYKETQNNISFLVQPKIDGLSISLKYKNGELKQCVTRGDGETGEDVSSNIINIIKDIPTKINYLNDLEVRGEVYISKAMFEKIKKEENVDYANSRNLASGTLRQLDSKIVSERNLSSFIYEIVDYERHNIETQKQLIDFLKENNFTFLEDYKIYGLDEQNKIFDFINDFEESKRNLLEYDIDGMVLKLNEIKYYDELGFTSKFPKFAIAYKFNEEISQTNIEDIFITIGRTGIATYNAKLKTVLLKGTMVSAATLHNYNYVEELNLNIGDEVLIKKAGEIIPKVVGVSTKKSVGVFPKIKICPYCNTELKDTKTLNNQICPNANCSEINIKKIIHFTSKQAMNIDGLGENIVRKFYEMNILKKIEDIFTLNNHKEEIINQKGFGVKFWQNLYEGIKKSYSVSLQNLIFALGIPLLGKRNAKLLANEIKKFENILKLDTNELNKIRDIGETTIQEINDFLNNEKDINLIKYLIQIGINPEINETSGVKNDFFKNKTFVISGTLSLTRDQIREIIESNGGNVSNSISKNTFALILGDGGGTKILKAKELKIRIIEKDEFEKIIKS